MGLERPNPAIMLRLRARVKMANPLHQTQPNKREYGHRRAGAEHGHLRCETSQNGNRVRSLLAFCLTSPSHLR